jgi:hypothetical protein
VTGLEAATSNSVMRHHGEKNNGYYIKVLPDRVASVAARSEKSNLRIKC